MKQNKPPFKGRRFEPTVILLCARRHCRHLLSYRDPEEMMRERSPSVEHVTIIRRVRRHTPETSKLLRTHLRMSGRFKSRPA